MRIFYRLFETIHLCTFTSSIDLYHLQRWSYAVFFPTSALPQCCGVMNWLYGSMQTFKWFAVADLQNWTFATWSQIRIRVCWDPKLIAEAEPDLDQKIVFNPDRRVVDYYFHFNLGSGSGAKSRSASDIFLDRDPALHKQIISNPDRSEPRSGRELRK